MKKYSLTAQIAEAKRELAIRTSAYPRFVASRRMREGEAAIHLDLQRNIVATLEWLAKHEAAVKAAIRRAAYETPPSDAETTETETPA